MSMPIVGVATYTADFLLAAVQGRFSVLVYQISRCRTQSKLGYSITAVMYAACYRKMNFLRQKHSLIVSPPASSNPRSASVSLPPQLCSLMACTVCIFSIPAMWALGLSGSALGQSQPAQSPSVSLTGASPKTICSQLLTFRNADRATKKPTSSNNPRIIYNVCETSCR